MSLSRRASQVAQSSSWGDALDFIAERAGGERIAFVFDEFPYAAQSDPSLPSVLQEKSPLYGRRTGQIHLAPFDCFDAALMVPGINHEQALRYYASFPDAGIAGITCCSPITPSVREPVRRRGRTPI